MRIWLLVAVVWALSPVDRVQAAESSAAPAPTTAIRKLPTRVSPVEAFRKLLVMNPAERDNFLTNYPPANRAKILEKIQEYELYPQELRELRLQATELRWYLLPLLKAPPTNRAAQLSSIPEPYQNLIRARLEEWDVWPPQLKEEILEYESTMNYLVSRNAMHPQGNVEDLSVRERSELERKLARWKALPEGQRQQMYATFQRYFDLSEEEKQRTLETLSEAERQETAKTLDPIEKWSRSERQQHLAAFHQFERMSPAERQQFMKNAERWRKMSEAERQAWRDLIKHVPDEPPYPPGVSPPRQQPAGSGSPSSSRTNPTAARVN